MLRLGIRDAGQTRVSGVRVAFGGRLEVRRYLDDNISEDQDVVGAALVMEAGHAEPPARGMHWRARAAMTRQVEAGEEFAAQEAQLLDESSSLDPSEPDGCANPCTWTFETTDLALTAGGRRGAFRGAATIGGRWLEFTEIEDDGYWWSERLERRASLGVLAELAPGRLDARAGLRDASVDGGDVILHGYEDRLLITGTSPEATFHHLGLSASGPLGPVRLQAAVSHWDLELGGLPLESHLTDGIQVAKEFLTRRAEVHRTVRLSAELDLAGGWGVGVDWSLQELVSDFGVRVFGIEDFAAYERTRIGGRLFWRGAGAASRGGGPA